MAKTYGWDLDYIGKLPVKTTNILANCIAIEIEKQEAEMKRQQARMRR